MKKDTHPKYFDKCQVKCACGNAFEIGSTKDYIETEVCFRCHPFYTGNDKIIDTAGRVDKFKKRLAKKTELKAKPKKERANKQESKKII